MLSITLAAWRARIADRDRLARVEILRHLAAQVDRVAGDDGLAEVVAELLLGVGVGGVERAHPHVAAGGDAVAHRVAPVAGRHRSRPASIWSESPAASFTIASGPSQSNDR